MAKITRKSTEPSIKLMDLLRKRRITLKKFISDFGINSFESLKLRCERMGVVPPIESKFLEAKGEEFVNSPTDGILVLEAPKVVKEKTGEEFEPENTVLESNNQITVENVVTQSQDSDNVISMVDESRKNKKISKNKWQTPIFASPEIEDNLSSVDVVNLS